MAHGTLRYTFVASRVDSTPQTSRGCGFSECSWASREATLETTIPAGLTSELYDLRVTADGGLDDTTRHSVRVIPDFKTDWYFVHVTDTHLPTHYYWDGWRMAEVRNGSNQFFKQYLWGRQYVDELVRLQTSGNYT